MTRKYFASIVAAVSLVLPAFVLAQSLAGADVDDDGTSDFTLISIESDTSLTWASYSASGAAISGSTSSLGQSGNHIALANWGSRTKAQRGYLKVEGPKVLWTVIPESGVPVARALGGHKDTLLSGADFNGNGFADGAYIRKPQEGETLYNWRIRYDFFRDIEGRRKGPRSVKKFRFGTVGDTAFFANVQGKGDWMAVLGVNPKGLGSRLSFMNPKTGKIKRFKVPSFTEGTLRPLALRQAQGGDLLALGRHDGGNTTVKFVNMRGVVVSEVTLSGTGELVVGDYIPAPGQELAIQLDGGAFLVHNPVTAEQRSVSAPSGIVVDDININSFDPNPEDPGCEDETLSPFDGTDKFLWKPKGIHSGALRVLWPQVWTGKIVEVVILSPEGNFVERASVSYDATNPNARTFAIFTKPGGRYPPGLTVRARLRAGCFKSYVINNPAARND